MRSVVFTDIPLSLHNAETEVLYLNAIDESVSPDLIVWYFASGAGVSFSTNACRGGSVLDGMRCDTCLIADQVPDGERTILAVSLGTFRDPSSPMTIQRPSAISRTRMSPSCSRKVSLTSMTVFSGKASTTFSSLWLTKSGRILLAPRNLDGVASRREHYQISFLKVGPRAAHFPSLL